MSSGRSEGRRLVRRFAVGSLAAFLLTGVGVAAIMARAVRSQGEAGATFHARTVAIEVVRPLLVPDDLAAPATGARNEELRRIVDSRVLSDGRIVRVKLWDTNGTILFSDDPQLVGRHFPGEPDPPVLRGEEVSDVSDLRDPENAEERSLGSKLFQTYIPLRATATGPVVGAIEIYQTYAYVQAEVDHLLTVLGLAFGGGLAALYLVLLPIVVRADSRLRDRNDRLSKQADQLREAEAKYRDLVERLPAIVYAADFDPAGSWLYVSPQIEHILGFTPQEWTDDPTLFDVQIHPDDEPRYRAIEARDKESGGPFRTEYRMFGKDGREVWLRDDAFVVTDRDGRKFLQGIMFDVTELKRAEETLRIGLEREQEASEGLRALDQMRNSFLQAVSHELRTPLTSVLGFALTLQRPDLRLSEAERSEMLDRLAANARKLERLLSDLLDVDRLARGVVEPKLLPLDLGALARSVTGETDVGSRALVVDAPYVEVVADGAKVERIMENLLVNASRHTPEGSHIWLRVRRHDGGAIIAVEDDGPGVPDEIKAAVFEPFRQGPAIGGQNSGTGIGLSLVANFAGLHGGRAWVEDRAGGGASFQVFLPADPSANGQAPAAPRGNGARSARRVDATSG